MSTKTVYTGPLTTLTAYNGDTSNVLTSSGCAGSAGSYVCDGCTYGVSPNGTAGTGQSFGVNWDTGVIVDLNAGCFLSLLPGSDGVPLVGASDTPTKWVFSFGDGPWTPYIYTISHDGQYAFLCMNTTGVYASVVTDPTTFNNQDGIWWFVSKGTPVSGAKYGEWKKPTKKSDSYFSTKREDEWLIWGSFFAGLGLLAVMAAK